MPSPTPQPPEHNEDRGIERPRTSVWPAAGKLGIACLGILAALLLLELLARLAIPAPYAPRSAPASQQAKGLFDVQCDRLVGWRGIADHQKQMNTEGYQHPVVLNSRGMHDTEHDFAKPEGTLRVLVLGDSFVEAEQVTQAETSAQVLEDVLNAEAAGMRQVEVVAAGVGGWGPAQELMYYRTEGRRYNPDVVVVMWFFANDLQDNLPDARRTGQAGVNCYAPYFVLCDGDASMDPRPWFSAPGLQPTWGQCPPGKRALSAGLSWLYAHSHIYQALEPLIVPRQPRLEFQPMYAPWLETIQDDPLLTYAYDLNTAIYAQLAAEVNADGAQVVFVFVPLREAVLLQALPDLSRVTLPVEKDDREHINATLPNQILGAKMDALGLPALDLLPAFTDYVGSGHPLPYGQTGDFHWNAGGNRLAAKEIADWLADHGWTP